MSQYSIDSTSTPEKFVVLDGCFRFSVISNRILRVEKSKRELFENLPTQAVWHRFVGRPQYKCTKNGNKMRIETAAVTFVFDEKKFDCTVLVDGKTANPRDARANLKGTRRTLDFTMGAVKLENGLFSRNGASWYDDSDSLVINGEGNVAPRIEKEKDVYIFAFGDDYLGGLKEFYALTGNTPRLPKYALGNWWSRYYAYNQAEYLALMDKFEQKKVPLTVATIDMDWHLVKNLPSDVTSATPQGKGWTGYTFNKELFPDHKAFFADLKKRGLAITLNLHPRDGVRYFEEQYDDVAKACGIDPASKQAVPFDLVNLNFRDAYFKYLHHPYENEGVDFWWIDWQQGKKSQVANLDPLWMLNHYHTLDINRVSRAALASAKTSEEDKYKIAEQPSNIILSRYSGLGAHRYPLGFSGDTLVCWSALKFQPNMTATASNVGYTWWSHDIGGHMFNHGNGELYLRWLQFGAFSPINRLHSSNTSKVDKEPWLYAPEIEQYAEDILRLRHRMLPYLYTASVLTSTEGVPLIQPMYYTDKSSSAYLAKNQYTFGSELLVAPVVERGHAVKSKQADGSVKKDICSTLAVYLPEGNWTNFFNGQKLGGGWHNVSVGLGEMAVYAKEGAIVPMIAEREGNSTAFDDVEVRIYAGENQYTMFDDVGHIVFALTRDGKGGYNLDIAPSADSTVKSVLVKCVDFDCAAVSVRGSAVAKGKNVKVKF